MPLSPPAALASAAESRRRELPVAIALTMLIGGVAAAITGASLPVIWAAVMSVVLIADVNIYRRLDRVEASIEGRTQTALMAWAGFGAAFFSVLPISLWLDGAPAAAAAAILLWVVGVVRSFAPGLGGALPVAIGGAAPPALSLLATPLLTAGVSASQDWDFAIIAALGGAALTAYVIHAGLAAASAERALLDARNNDSASHVLAGLVLDQGWAAAALIDRGGRIIAMTESMRQGLGIEAAVGKTAAEALGILTETWAESFACSLAGDVVRHKENAIQAPLGVRWFNWETRPWRDDAGAITGVLCHGIDVTSLVKARGAAANTEACLKLALESSGGVVWEVDFKAKSIHWHADPLPLYGCTITFEEFIGNSTNVLLEEERAMLDAYMRRVMAGEQAGCIEHRVPRADGDVTWIEASAHRVLEPSGEVRKLIILSRDITDRKRQEAAFIGALHRAEENLISKRALFGEDAGAVGAIDEGEVHIGEMFERLDRIMAETKIRDGKLAEIMASLRAAREAADAASASKSQFLASMSHELRTPLNAIIGYSEMLLEGAETEGRDGDVADTNHVLSAARQLLHLINDILDLSKIEAGRMDVVPSAFNLAVLIEEAGATVRPNAEKGGNRLEIEVDQDIGEIISDAFKLNQCVLNLLSNAVKFTKNGDIRVRARRVEDSIEVEVRDSGIGMTDQQVARLFNAFVQADAATAQTYGGTGLGLVLTRRIMRLLGGDVSVSSAQGEGSAFTLRLPLTIDGATAEVAAPAPQASPHGAERVILLIDDEDSARDLTTRALTRLGFRVETAKTGGAGLELAEKLRPALIVLDLNLPDISGWQVLSKLKSSDVAHIPVVIHSVDDERRRKRQSLACAHFVKPVRRDILAATVLRYALQGDEAPAASTAEAPSADSVAKRA